MFTSNLNTLADLRTAEYEYQIDILCPCLYKKEDAPTTIYQNNEKIDNAIFMECWYKLKREYLISGSW